MKLLFWTSDDPASLRIAGALVKVGLFPEAVGDGTVRVDRTAGAALAKVEGSLLAADFADRGVSLQVEQRFERALFLSKHIASSGVPSFTVHPIGNLGRAAAFGGAPRTLAPADPPFQTRLLQALMPEARAQGVSATFEATHHGPRMDIPSLFVEVGSRPQDWEDPALCSAVARAVVAGYLDPPPTLVMAKAIGIGGGHYVPAQTDHARRTATAYGHLIPHHALADLDDATVREAAAVSGATACWVDARKADEKKLARAMALLEAEGVVTEHLRG